jgi:dipeptidase
MKIKFQCTMARFACTTMIAGKKATNDGSVIVAHSDDDVADERVIYVPEQTFDKDDKRNVYYDDASLGPNPTYNATVLRRYIGSDRGPGYRPVPGEPFAPSKPLGAIPQYPTDDPAYPIPLPKDLKTYAYFDSNYGIMNEHSLMFGECTCGAKIHPNPEPGNRIFYSSELSRVALERCTNAVDAIKLMGYLIKKYGYYGTGETLLVGDKNEAWVMEMCGYDEAGTDGIWVAKRVPDEHFFIAANQFRIREVDPNEGEKDLLFSENLFEVCKEKGWWNPSHGTLDWLPTVSWGEYSHPYYSLRRVWRGMSLVAPSLNLSPLVDDGYTKEYPFSIKPDKPLAVADIANVYRDHYEGTEFDLTRGLAAGPFGNPARYEKNPDQGDTFNLNKYHPEGAWERPLSIYRCGMMWINQARPDMPPPTTGISWIGLDRPSTTCLMPFYAGATELPKKMETMILTQFDRKNSAWWAFNFVANYATIKYCYMIQDIRKAQQELEESCREEVAEFDKNYAASLPSDDQQETATTINDFCSSILENVLNRWWRLSDTLIVKYNDGCITDGEEIMGQVGYPRYWLSYVGYFDGPISYKKPDRKGGAPLS